MKKKCLPPYQFNEIQNIIKKQPELSISGSSETWHRIEFLGLITKPLHIELHPAFTAFLDISWSHWQNIVPLQAHLSSLWWTWSNAYVKHQSLEDTVWQKWCQLVPHSDLTFMARLLLSAPPPMSFFLQPLISPPPICVIISTSLSPDGLWQCVPWALC